LGTELSGDACLVDEPSIVGDVAFALLLNAGQRVAAGPAGLLGVRFLTEIHGDRPPLIEGRRPE
jgi:hypothetical protein